MSKNKTYVTKICICALLAALYVPLEWLASEFGVIALLDKYQIPISCFPLILASIMFGIGWGTATATVGSLISQLIIIGTNAGASAVTIPIWMAPTIIYAFLVAFLYQLFKNSDNRILLGVQFFISSLVLSSLNIIALYLDSIIVGWPYDFIKSFFGLFVSLKIIGGLLFAIIFAIIVPPIIKKLKSILKF